MKRCYVLRRLSPRQRWMYRALALALLAIPYAARGEGQTLRVGHFPNITHVQALIAHGLSRQGKGWFEERLPGVKIDWFVYNAGPSAMEAIFADSIDLTYVGPNPAINAHIKSRGQEVRIVAGAAEGGAGLVVQPELPLNTAQDFKGRRIATPQFGNTQDVSARAWLAAGGLKITQTGGDAQVVPAANPDQLSLFKTKQVDAVWTIEPWLSRLEIEAGGKVLVEDRTSITTVLVSSAKRLAASRALVARFVAAHKELTAWINAHPEEAQRLARDEIEAETHFPVAPDLIARAWKRIVVTGEVSRKPLEDFVQNAQLAGFLRDSGDISHLVETP
jgi:NitT/TauT family transport system substrate-binding protein